MKIAVMARACATLSLVALLATAAAAQNGQPPAVQAAPAPPAADAPISAGQIQKWFEAFTVLQAQDALQLSEAQYGKFVTRLKALQETRRSHQQARTKILNDLRKLTNPQVGSQDDAAIGERLKALRDEDDRMAADIRKGYEGVDETLDLKQQARFRIFEDRMEQQKLDLLMRARLSARAQRGRKGGAH